MPRKSAGSDSFTGNIFKFGRESMLTDVTAIFQILFNNFKTPTSILVFQV